MSDGASVLARPSRDDDGSSKCLLIVEDHQNTLDVLRRLFEMEGYRVLSATSARQARQLVAARGCDLVISDLALPDGSGLDLMGELRDAYGLRGIAVSGFTSPSAFDEARAAGFQRFLDKPVQFETLSGVVRDLLT